jgi:WD40 repeat protein
MRMKRLEPAQSSDAFDWAMGILSALLMAGIILDGWAHNHGKVDESFLTPWHAVLYGTMTLNGLVLLAVGVINLRKRAGQSFRDAAADSIPFGYWSSAIGVILFIVAGGFDFAWHTLFGIETDINALVSPTHLALGLAAAMVFSGPIRSVAHRYGPDSGGWRKVGPVVPALAAVLTLVGFFTQYAQPAANDGIASVMAKNDDAPVVESLYAMQSDGSSQRRLAPSTRDDAFAPAVSPDGQLVVYRVLRNGSAASDLYVARVDGAGSARRITHTGRHDTQPAWSPDGALIAFISLPADTSGENRLNVVRPDGASPRMILHGVATITGPAWSPDGKRIAVCSRNGVIDEIEVVDVASGSAKFLAGADGSWPAWSQDGSAIYFSTTDAQGNRMSISAVSADGTGNNRVVVPGGAMPALSPDGRRLAYVRADRGTDQIFVADVNGRGAVDVSRLSGLDAARPAWAGYRQILFVASGRSKPAASDYALALSLSGVLVQAIVVAGTILLIVRRWRAPAGAATVILVLFAAAMATQNDDYFAVPAALAAGVVVDTLLLLWGDRARSGLYLYAIGFALPFLLSAAYLVFLDAARGIGWPPNMLFGSPFIAGFAGLLVAFAFDPPLQQLSRGATSN